MGHCRRRESGPCGVANLRERLTRQTVTYADLAQDIALGNDRLAKIIGTADGFQVTSETLSTAHHTANVLFNVMRGGLLMKLCHLETRLPEFL